MESSSFWNPESTVLESGILTRNPESTAWNPESKTVLDSLTWGEIKVCVVFSIIIIIIIIITFAASPQESSTLIFLCPLVTWVS